MKKYYSRTEAWCRLDHTLRGEGPFNYVQYAVFDEYKPNTCIREYKNMNTSIGPKGQHSDQIVHNVQFFILTRGDARYVPGTEIDNMDLTYEIKTQQSKHNNQNLVQLETN